MLECWVLVYNEGTAEEEIEHVEGQLCVYLDRKCAEKDAQDWTSDNARYTVKAAKIVLVETLHGTP